MTDNTCPLQRGPGGLGPETKRKMCDGADISPRSKGLEDEGTLNARLLDKLLGADTILHIGTGNAFESKPTQPVWKGCARMRRPHSPLETGTCWSRISRGPFRCWQICSLLELARLLYYPAGSICLGTGMHPAAGLARQGIPLPAGIRQRLPGRHLPV